MMESKYYLVIQKQHVHPLFIRPSQVFVSISAGKLEHITGDIVIFSLLGLKNGELKIKKEALLNYDIIPFKDKTQYEFYKAVGEGRTCGTGRIRTYRDPINRTIFVGEI